MMFSHSRFLSAVLVCGAMSACDAQHESSSELSSMDDTMVALRSAVASCADQLDVCTTADAGLDDACKDRFQACKEAALDNAMPHLGESVSGCAETSRTCRKSAADADAKRACTDQLKLCVAESKDDDMRAAHDGGVNAEHASPVASCTTALRSCIESDAQAKVCTDALRACLADTLPRYAGGRDGGAAENRGSDNASAHKPLDAGASHEPNESAQGNGARDAGNRGGKDR